MIFNSINKKKLLILRDFSSYLACQTPFIFAPHLRGDRGNSDLVHIDHRLGESMFTSAKQSQFHEQKDPIGILDSPARDSNLCGCK